MDNDLKLLMNKDSKGVLQEDNSLSFGSGNEDEDNDWGDMTPDNNNDGEDFDYDDNEDNFDDDNDEEEEVSVFSSEKEKTGDDDLSPNLFVSPQSKNTNMNGNNYMNTSTFNVSQSREQIEQEKQEILYQIERLKKRGVNFPRSFNMSSNLSDMKQELMRIKRDMEVDASIHFQRKTLITLISGMEFANNKFNPLQFKLDGWSENISDNINDYDDIFEKLYDKYKGKGNMPPELHLLMMVAGSGFMTHMTNTLFKQAGQSMTVEQLFKNNPDLQKQFAGAAVDQMQKENTNPQNSGMLNMFKGMFSGGEETQTRSVPMQVPVSQPKMKGPNTSDIDNILEELNLSKQNTPADIDNFEKMSQVSDNNKSSTSLMSSLLSKDRKGKKSIML